MHQHNTPFLRTTPINRGATVPPNFTKSPEPWNFTFLLKGEPQGMVFTRTTTSICIRESLKYVILREIGYNSFYTTMPEGVRKCLEKSNQIRTTNGNPLEE